MIPAENLILAIGAALVLSGASLLDGPSEQELAEATAASLRDAQAQAEQEARRYRTPEQIARDVCRRLHGARAQLLRLQEGDGYACRRNANA